MEKMQHIQILQIKEIPFEVNREVNITADMMKDVKFSFLIVLQHIKGNDVVGLHTVVRYYLPDGKELLQGGATVIAKLSNWIELEDDDKKSNLRLWYWILFLMPMPLLVDCSIRKQKVRL